MPATAKDSNSPKAHRREGYLATLQIKPVIFTLLRCTSAELLFSCFESVAAQRATAWTPRSSTCDKQRPAPRAESWAPRWSTCDKQRAAPRAKAWAQHQVTATHNERRRRLWPWHHGEVPAQRRGNRSGHRG